MKQTYCWLGEGVRVHDLDEDGGIRESDVSFAGEVLLLKEWVNEWMNEKKNYIF